MKRSPGYTMMMAIISSKWAKKGFPGFKNARKIGPCLGDYLIDGDFNNGQKADFLPSLYDHYKVNARRNEERIESMPPRLVNNIKELHRWRKSGRSIREFPGDTKKHAARS